MPAITAAGVHTLAWILTGFVTASALLGLFFAPSNAGKSLEEIQRERSGDEEPRFTRDGERVRPGASTETATTMTRSES